MKEAPTTWYDMLAATAEVLPWREEAGVQVLGQSFSPAASAPAPQSLPKGAGGAGLPTPAMLATPVLAAEPDTEEQAFGRAVHQLLQGLPLPPHHPHAARAEAAAQGVRAALPWLWAKGSRGEVALVLPNGQVGRADRLVPHNGAWWVIDFKTGVPQAPVPAAYVAQLQGYAQALAASLPEAKICAAIVWVATASLAEVPCNG